MTDDSRAKGASSVVFRFAELHGINRRRAVLAAALVGSLLLIALFVMNQRIQARKAASMEQADSAAIEPPVEPASADGERAAWADPQQARRLVEGTLPAAPSAPDTAAGGSYVPVGGDVGPGEYVARSGGAASATDTVPGEPRAAVGDAPGFERPLTPAEMRVAAYQRAVASRQLRGRRGGSAEKDSGQAQTSGPVGGEAGRAEGGPGGELQPYGAAEIEEDRRAAERAADQFTPPVPPVPLAAAFPRGRSAGFSFASNEMRPCGSGERILAAGTVITATLATAINSEAAGPVLARIGRDVYDAGLRCVIFPAGTLLVGRYPQGLEHGGERLVVHWEQVVLGDGRSWSLPRLPSADRQGNTGIVGRVDRRTRERFEGVALLSAIGAAIEYATPGGGEGVSGPGGYPAPTPRDRAVGAATEPLRGASERLLERVDGIRPVLRAGAGAPIAVIVPQTVNLDHPAALAPADSIPPRVPPAQAPTPS